MKIEGAADQLSSVHQDGICVLGKAHMRVIFDVPSPAHDPRFAGDVL